MSKRPKKPALTGVDIIRIRAKLGLTQAQADELLGDGDKSFGKYEDNTLPCPSWTQNFLRILDKHPHLITEIVPEKAIA